MFVYKKTERNPDLYTVGHYSPAGKFEPESDHPTEHEAAIRTHWLNGGMDVALEHRLAAVEAHINRQIQHEEFASDSARRRESAFGPE